MSDRLTRDEARKITDEIKQALVFLDKLVIGAWESRVWESLEYDSWEDYCNAEFGSCRIKLPKPERQEVVSQMKAHRTPDGKAMSNPAIAAALGVDEKTVRNDLRSTSEKSEVESSSTIGLDGRTRRHPQRRQEPRTEAEAPDRPIFDQSDRHDPWRDLQANIKAKADAYSMSGFALELIKSVQALKDASQLEEKYRLQIIEQVEETITMLNQLTDMLSEPTIDWDAEAQRLM